MNYSPSHYDTWKLATPEERFGWPDDICERCEGPWDDSSDYRYCSMCLEEVFAERTRGSVEK